MLIVAAKCTNMTGDYQGHAVSLAGEQVALGEILIILHAIINVNLMSNSFNVNKNPTDAAVCRYLFTAKLLYVFRVSQHPSSGVLKFVPAASGTVHTTCTATPLQLGLILLMMGSVTPEICRVALQ